MWYSDCIELYYWNEERFWIKIKWIEQIIGKAIFFFWENIILRNEKVCPFYFFK